LDYEFHDPDTYAASGCGMIALNGKAPDIEQRIEEVLAHEAVHLVLEKLFADKPMRFMIQVQRMWDLADLPQARLYYQLKYRRLGVK